MLLSTQSALHCEGGISSSTTSIYLFIYFLFYTYMHFNIQYNCVLQTVKPFISSQNESIHKMNTADVWACSSGLVKLGPLFLVGVNCPPACFTVKHYRADWVTLTALMMSCVSSRVTTHQRDSFTVCPHKDTAQCCPYYQKRRHFSSKKHLGIVFCFCFLHGNI